MIQAKYNIGDRVIDRGRYEAEIIGRNIELVGFRFVLYYRIKHLHSGQTFRAYEDEISK